MINVLTSNCIHFNTDSKFADKMMEMNRIIKINRFFLFLAVFSVVCMNAGIIFAQEESSPEMPDIDPDKILAVGDGIRITFQDIENTRLYFESKNFLTTPEGYRSAALEIYLYAEEADKQEVGAGENVADDPFEQRKARAEAYFKKVIEGYPISDLAIESYYLSHPSKFKTWSEAAQEYTMEPLDDELREKIRSYIVSTKTSSIRKEEFERLKEKYNVRLCDPKLGCTEEELGNI